jgi:YihY family inner membrane protein
MPPNTPALRIVPETISLEGDDAIRMLRRAGPGRVAAGALRRFAHADGTTHVRALGHAGLLTMVSTLIVIVGVATTFGLRSFADVVEGSMRRIAPGASGTFLHQALSQGSRVAGSAALLAGIASSLWSGTIFMALLERGANRVYGLPIDRPLGRRYARALQLDLTAGTLLTAALLLLALGPAVAHTLGHLGASLGTASTVWSWARWPLGIVLAAAGVTLLYRLVPARRQPGLSWLAAGGALATVLWIGFTALLAVYLRVASGAGSTYGPLLGLVGMVLWSYLSGLALLLGLAFCAELESVRAGPDVGGPLSG